MSIRALFVFLAVVGGSIAILQALASLVGLGGDGDTDLHGGDGAEPHLHGAGDAMHSALGVFNFRSIRAIASGLGFAGIGGLVALRHLPSPLAAAVAALLGLSMYLMVAFIMRGISRLDADNTVHPLRAVGLEGTVSLSVPALGAGPGKVVLVVAGRRVEWPAVQPESAAPESPLPSGTLVQVVDAADDTTLTVVPVTQHPRFTLT